MKAFIISALFGAFEVFLLGKLLTAVTAGNRKKAFGFFALKFITYGIAIAILMFRHISLAMYCLCGFAVGMPISAIALFIYRAFIKKDLK